jgi:hypothetical protein
MRSGAGYRLGAVIGILLLLALGLCFLKPREFLLSYCAIGPLIVSLFIIVWSRRPVLRNGFLALASASLVVALLDPITYLTDRPVVQAEGSWNSTFHYQWDDELGTALPPNVVAQARKSTDHGIISDVTYSFDGNGHRKTLGSTDPLADSVVFMGCSFTFGEGVQDSETLPQQFSDQTGRKYNVSNFGISSFGIQQPLRALEVGRLDPILSAGKRYVVYTGIPDHAYRVVTGYRRGPVYALQGDGSVKYLGSGETGWQVIAVAMANRSLFLRNFVITPLFDANPSYDVPLYTALVRRAGRIAREKYGAKFIVVFWDNPGSSVSAEVMAAFDKAGIAYVRVSTMLPGFLQNDSMYRLSSYDGHPNALADHLIGLYLARHLDDIPAQPAD